jgi:hypothetical protein
MDCEINLCKESDFPPDSVRKYYFTIRKPNPENKDAPFQVSIVIIFLRMLSCFTKL